MKRDLPRFLLLALMAWMPFFASADETSVNDTDAKAIPQKPTLHDEQIRYEQERDAFRAAQSEWVLEQLEANDFRADPGLLRAQFVRANLEWRVHVEELKFNYQHALGKHHVRNKDAGVELALQSALTANVQQLKDQASAAKDSRQWRTAIAYERAARDVVYLEAQAEAEPEVQEVPAQ